MSPFDQENIVIISCVLARVLRNNGTVLKRIFDVIHGGSMKKTRCNAIDWICSVACTVLAIILFSSASYAADVRHLWQSREQFVALEPQDSTLYRPGATQ